MDERAAGRSNPGMANRPKIIEFNGETRSITEWARRARIPVETLRSRLIRLKWPFARAIGSASDPRFAPVKRIVKRKVRPVPKIEKHESGSAYCRWMSGGVRRAVFLGEFGSIDAVERYARFAAEWRANGGHAQPHVGEKLYVASLIERFLDWAPTYYRKGNRPTSEVSAFTSAMLPVNELYGAVAVVEFTPDRLRVVQNAFVEKGLARKTVNAYVRRVVRVFRWAVGRSLCPAAIADALSHVEPLKRGRTTAREVPKRRSVHPLIVEKTIPHLHANPKRQRVLAAMVTVQRYTGMRPGALTAMRRKDVHGEPDGLLRYEVTDEGNKTAHLDREMVFWIGPKACEAIAPLLANLRPNDFVFAFTTPYRREKRIHVSRTDYARFVARACERAGVTAWSPPDEPKVGDFSAHLHLPRQPRPTSLPATRASVAPTTLAGRWRGVKAGGTLTEDDDGEVPKEARCD